MEPLAERLAIGRVFTGTRKVRLGDVSPRGRLRFDALTRYTQDVSNDDTLDARISDVPGWVVRSTVVDEIQPARYGETLTFTTFCAGFGKRWAERRLSVVGDGNRGHDGVRPGSREAPPAHYELATLWVCVDHATGQPRPLTEQFLEVYAEAAGGRTASARQQNPKLRTVAEEAQISVPWQLRKVDFDTLGHVNNAAYWATIEEWLTETSPPPRRARIEYGAGLRRAPSVEVITANLDAESLGLWWMQDDKPAATASIRPLPGDLYAGSPAAG